MQETPLPGPWHWFVAPTFREAMLRLEGYDVIAIDMPLAADGVRPSDASAYGTRSAYRHTSDKVRQVRAYLRTVPDAANVIYEVHPKLSFVELQGGFALPHKAQRKFLFKDRMSYLCDVFPYQTLADALAAYPRSEVANADVLDAFAMLWSAKRIANSCAERLPSTPVYDARGIDMAVWY